MAALTDKLRAVMALDPERTEIDFAGRDYSWGQLAGVARRIEAALDAMALPNDARVGIALRNRPGHVAAIAAVLASDRCLVTLNPLLPDARLAADIAGLELAAAVLGEEDAARGAVTAALVDAGVTVVVIGDRLEGARLLPGCERPRGAVASSPGVAIEMLTSGTTGAPKRVPLTRRAYEASFAGFTAYERGRAADEPPRLRSGVTMVVNPLTHIGGIYGCIGALLNGRKIALLERFTVEGWVEAVRRNRPKVAPAVPSAVRMLLDAEVDPADLASLTALISGTAPLDPDLVDAFYAKFGIPICSNYGATEFAGAIAGWTIDDFRAHWQAKRGAAGRIHGNVAARVVDTVSGTPLPPGEEGLLELQGSQLGPNYPIGGAAWLRTTDRAAIDDDRFLFVRGRADNAIVRGGFKVHPEDVATALEEHAAVREAAVVGIPDRRLGQVPAAAVILRGGAEPPSEDDLRAWLRERLLPYQVPAQIRFVADFPRTPSMKPSAPGLRALFEQDEVAA